MTQRGPERVRQEPSLSNNILPDHPSMDRLTGIAIPAAAQSAYYMRLTKSFNNEIDALNSLIDSYNTVSNIEQKRAALKVIEELAQYIREAFPGDFLSTLEGYHSGMNTQFFNQVNQQQKILNKTQPSVVPIIPALKPPTTLEEMVAKISPEKLEELMEILSKGKFYNRQKLQNLYPIPTTEEEKLNESIADKEEREMFESFLANHTISFLGGGNAQNFRIQRINSSEEKVLKVEYRLDSPKAAARDLRENALKGKMTEIFAERQSTFEHAKHGLTTCSLLVTPLIRGGDLEHYASELPMDNDARIEHTLDLGTQMADIFLAIQQANYIFPDPKTSNWLVNEEGRLQIADDKSFIPTQKKSGEYSKQYALEGGYDGIIRSEYMEPNELNEPSFNIDSMHVYMLGKNLYQIMTNCHSSNLKSPSLSDDLHFDYYDVFKTAEGKLIKEIIQQSIQPEAKNRISLTEATERLMAISFNRKAPSIINAAEDLLQKLRTVDSKDIDKYNTLSSDIKKATKIEVLESQLADIKNKASVFQERLTQDINTLLNQSLLFKADISQHGILESINVTTQVNLGELDTTAVINLQHKKEGLQVLANVVSGASKKVKTQEDCLKINNIVVNCALKVMQTTEPAQIAAMTKIAAKEIKKIANPGILQRIVKAISGLLLAMNARFSKADPVKAEPIKVGPAKAEPVNLAKPPKPPKPPKPHKPTVASVSSASTQQAMSQVLSSLEKVNGTQKNVKVESNNTIRNEPPSLK